MSSRTSTVEWYSDPFKPIFDGVYLVVLPGGEVQVATYSRSREPRWRGVHKKNIAPECWCYFPAPPGIDFTKRLKAK